LQFATAMDDVKPQMHQPQNGQQTQDGLPTPQKVNQPPVDQPSPESWEVDPPSTQPQKVDQRLLPTESQDSQKVSQPSTDSQEVVQSLTDTQIIDPTEPQKDEQLQADEPAVDKPQSWWGSSLFGSTPPKEDPVQNTQQTPPQKDEQSQEGWGSLWGYLNNTPQKDDEVSDSKPTVDQPKPTVSQEDEQPQKGWGMSSFFNYFGNTPQNDDQVQNGETVSQNDEQEPTVPQDEQPQEEHSSLWGKIKGCGSSIYDNCVIKPGAYLQDKAKGTFVETFVNYVMGNGKVCEECDGYGSFECCSTAGCKGTKTDDGTITSCSECNASPWQDQCACKGADPDARGTGCPADRRCEKCTCPKCDGKGQVPVDNETPAEETDSVADETSRESESSVSRNPQAHALEPLLEKINESKNDANLHRR
jgi:hypothetical protein